MTGFDPAAATAAYLAQLPPDLLARAAAYTHGNEWLLLWDWLVNVVALVLVLKSGILVRLRAWLEKSRPRAITAPFLVALAFMIADILLTLPWEMYKSWWRERAFGFSTQSLASWLADSLIQSLISALIIGVAAIAIYALLRSAGRFWWVWASGFIAIALVGILMFVPTFLAPLLNDYKPAPEGMIKDAVVPLARAAGIAESKIFVYNGSKQSNRYTANVAGIFGTARIAMSDTMFEDGVDVAAVRGVVAHEIGHYVHNDPLIFLAIAVPFALLTFWLMDRLFPALAHVLGGKIEGISDPAGLPILMMLFITVDLLGTPITNSATRMFESRADMFSLELAHEPDGLARALIKTAEYRNPKPTRIEEILFYDHPSAARRIRRIMDWKTAHLSEPSSGAH